MEGDRHASFPSCRDGDMRIESRRSRIHDDTPLNAADWRGFAWFNRERQTVVTKIKHPPIIIGAGSVHRHVEGAGDHSLPARRRISHIAAAAKWQAEELPAKAPQVTGHGEILIG